jgi:hypothetical protein
LITVDGTFRLILLENSVAKTVKRWGCSHVQEGASTAPARHLLNLRVLIREELKPAAIFFVNGVSPPAARLKDMGAGQHPSRRSYTLLSVLVFFVPQKPSFKRPASAYITIDWGVVSCAPNKFVGMGLIQLYRPEIGAVELERCAKIGRKVGMIWTVPGGSIRTTGRNMTGCWWRRRI